MKRAQNRHRSLLVEPHDTLGFDTMPELWLAHELYMTRHDIICELTKCDDRSKIPQQGQLAFEKRSTRFAFRRLGFVSRWCASNCRIYVGVDESEAVVGVCTRGLVCETRPMQCSEEPVAGAVAGEDSSRTVGPMRSRSQAQDQQRRGGIAKSGHGTSPVRVVDVCGSFDRGNFATPVHQPRTRLAGRDVFAKFGEGIHAMSLARNRRFSSADGFALR